MPHAPSSELQDLGRSVSTPQHSLNATRQGSGRETLRWAGTCSVQAAVGAGGTIAVPTVSRAPGATVHPGSACALLLASLLCCDTHRSSSPTADSLRSRLPADKVPTSPQVLLALGRHPEPRGPWAPGPSALARAPARLPPPPRGPWGASPQQRRLQAPSWCQHCLQRGRDVETPKTGNEDPHVRLPPLSREKAIPASAVTVPRLEGHREWRRKTAVSAPRSRLSRPSGG